MRNKISQLWVDIAKKSWAADWIDMDEILFQLWNGSLVHKQLVLSILESLSDDIFNRDDTTVALREGQLSRSCVAIFTPASVLSEYFPTRKRDVEVRYGEDGWLVRIGRLLDWCVDNDVYNNQEHR